MKIYALTRIQNPDCTMPWEFTSIVYASASISKVIDHAKNKYGIVIDTLDFVEIDEDEVYGYKVEEIDVEVRNK